MNNTARTGISRLRDPDVAMLALIAFAMPAELNVIGRLTLSDMLCAALAPFLLAFRFRYFRDGSSRIILMLGAFWFFSAVITDLIRETPHDDLARGWAKIIFFLVNFIAIRCLVKDSQYKAVLFAFCCALAEALKLAIGVGGVDFGNEILGTAWKFGYGFLFAQCCLLVAVYLRKRSIYYKLANYVPFISTIAALLTNARNLFAITLVSSMINMFRLPGRNIRMGLLFIYAIAGVIGLYGGIALYKYSASSGALGSDAQVKYESQAGNSLGLLAGRAEIFSSSKAIFDSPLIGHGSWAKDSRYRDFMLAKLSDAGVVVQSDAYASDLIPTHSHVFGAWVEAGLAGAIFWIYILYLVIRGLMKVNRFPSLLTGFVSLICLQFAWDIFFSPFGLDRRVVNAGWICLVIAVLNDSQTGQQVGRMRRLPA